MVLDIVMTDILDDESDAWNLIIYQVVSFPMPGPDIGYVNLVFIQLWMIMYMFQVMIHIWNIDHETSIFRCDDMVLLFSTKSFDQQ